MVGPTQLCNLANRLFTLETFAALRRAVHVRLDTEQEPGETRRYGRNRAGVQTAGLDVHVERIRHHRAAAPDRPVCRLLASENQLEIRRLPDCPSTDSTPVGVEALHIGNLIAGGRHLDDRVRCVHDFGEDQNRSRSFRAEGPLCRADKDSLSADLRADGTGRQRHPDQDARQQAGSQSLHRTHGFSSFMNARRFTVRSKISPPPRAYGMRMKSGSSRSANWFRLYAAPESTNPVESQPPLAAGAQKFSAAAPTRPPFTPVMRV